MSGCYNDCLQLAICPLSTSLGRTVGCPSRQPIAKTAVVSTCTGNRYSSLIADCTLRFLNVVDCNWYDKSSADREILSTEISNSEHFKPAVHRHRNLHPNSVIFIRGILGIEHLTSFDYTLSISNRFSRITSSRKNHPRFQ